MDKPSAVPTNCPVCSSPGTVHAYIDRPPKGWLGSIWIWCDRCFLFTHGSVRVPVWWQNLDAVDRRRLDGLMDYLGEASDEIDHHWVSLAVRHSPVDTDL